MRRSAELSDGCEHYALQLEKKATLVEGTHFGSRLCVERSEIRRNHHGHVCLQAGLHGRHRTDLGGNAAPAVDEVLATSQGTAAKVHKRLRSERVARPPRRGESPVPGPGGVLAAALSSHPGTTAVATPSAPGAMAKRPSATAPMPRRVPCRVPPPVVSGFAPRGTRVTASE